MAVAQSVTIVNRRLIDFFGEDPEKLQTVDPTAFETIVAELFELEGYTVVQTRSRADGGKDLYVLKTDPFTQTMYLVNAKGMFHNIAAHDLSVLVMQLHFERDLWTRKQIAACGPRNLRITRVNSVDALRSE